MYLLITIFSIITLSTLVSSSGEIFFPSENLSNSLVPPKTTNLVVIAHTVTKFCTTKCLSIVKSIQNQHPTTGYCNFLIGGDGKVYESRGWDYPYTLPNGDNFIEISIIGNFLYDHLNTEMMLAMDHLLQEGISLRKLDVDYKIVAHNQTKATLSPGVNVYKYIKELQHYSSQVFH